jgi:hypothetical protein
MVVLLSRVRGVRVRGRLSGVKCSRDMCACVVALRVWGMLVDALWE